MNKIFNYKFKMKFLEVIMQKLNNTIDIQIGGYINQTNLKYVGIEFVVL